MVTDVISQEEDRYQEKIHVWGEDDKPKATFDDGKALMEYIAKQCGWERGALMPARFSTGRKIMIGLGVVFILLGLFLKFRERNQAEA